MKSFNKKKGDEGEDIAVEFLLKKGFEIIERNYRFEKGEIDIIAKDKNEIVFIEVKTRKSLEFGLPEFSITNGKIKQLKRIASAYLWEKEIYETDCRFDVVAILMLDSSHPEINHLENAFN